MVWNEPITTKKMVLFVVGWTIGMVLPIAIDLMIDKWKNWRRK